MVQSRKLAAILVADVVGFSRLVGADEERTLARVRSLWGDFVDPAISAHHGRDHQADWRRRHFRISKRGRRCTVRDRASDWPDRAQFRSFTRSSNQVARRYPHG